MRTVSVHDPYASAVHSLAWVLINSVLATLLAVKLASICEVGISLMVETGYALLGGFVSTLGLTLLVRCLNPVHRSYSSWCKLLGFAFGNVGLVASSDFGAKVGNAELATAVASLHCTLALTWMRHRAEDDF